MNLFSYVYQARVPYITYYRESLTTWAWQPYRRVSLPSTYKSQLLFQWTRPGSCQQSNLYKYEFWRAFHQKPYSANSFRMTTHNDPVDRSHSPFHGMLSCYNKYPYLTIIYIVCPRVGLFTSSLVVTLQATQIAMAFLPVQCRLRNKTTIQKSLMDFKAPRS